MSEYAREVSSVGLAAAAALSALGGLAAAGRAILSGRATTGPTKPRCAPWRGPMAKRSENFIPKY